MRHHDYAVRDLLLAMRAVRRDRPGAICVWCWAATIRILMEAVVDRWPLGGRRYPLEEPDIVRGVNAAADVLAKRRPPRDPSCPLCELGLTA